ncbi:unnamed protein product [Closterium sp. Naga37s-1]|nr:unnamed protein product [Closterium sp. Naga37s-1]
MADVAGPSYALGSVTNIQTDNQGSPPSKFSEPLLVEVSELTVELEAWEDDLLTLSGDEAGDIGEIREVVAPVAAPMVPLELPAVSAEFSGSLNQDGLETPSSPMLFSPFLPEGGLSAEGEGFLDGLAPLSAFHENEELPLAVPSDDLDELDAILFPSLPGSMASIASIASSSNLSSPAALLSPPQQCYPFHHREHPRHKHKHKYKRAHALKQKHSQQFRDAPVFRRDISAARRALDRLLADGGIAGKRARSARGSTRGGCDCGHDGTKNERCAGGMPLEGRPVCDVGEDDRWRSEGRLFHVKREGGVAETLKFDRLELVESTLGPVVDRMGEPRNVANGATVANVADAPNAANVADVTSPAANAAANGANDTPVATNGIDGRSNGGAAIGVDDHLASRHAVSQSNIKTAECHCRVEGGAACAGRSEDSKRVNNKRPWSSPLVAYLLSPPSPRPAKRRSLPVSPAPSPISQGNSPSGYLSPGMETRVFRLPAAATSSAPAATPAPSAAAASAASADAPASPAAAAAGAFPSRRCSHCSTTTTPQWRTGPLGAKTLCNACGVRFKSGRLCPEYRPANSPGFSPNLHSNLHLKIVQMRERRGDEGGEGDCSAEDGVGAGELAMREVRGLRKIKKVKECVEGGAVEGVQGRSGNMGVAVVQEKAQERDHESFQERVQDKESMRHLVARDPSAAFVPPSLASSASATLRCPQCAAPISVPQPTTRATGADGAAVGTPGHGGASARTWGGGAGGGGGISGSGWRMAPFMRDSLATLGTAMGGTIASVYAFNAVMPRLGKRIPGSRGLQYLFGVPPVAVAAAAGAGVGAGTLPALIQLCMSSYYVTTMPLLPSCIHSFSHKQLPFEAPQKSFPVPQHHATATLMHPFMLHKPLPFYLFSLYLPHILSPSSLNDRAPRLTLPTVTSGRCPFVSAIPIL